MTAAEDRQLLLRAVEHGISAAPANSGKWRPLKQWFKDRFGSEAIPDVRSAEGKNITAEKQVWNRIHNELAGRDPKYAVITAVDSGLLPHIRRHLASTQYPRARAFLLLDGLEPEELQIYQSDEVTEALEEMFPDATLVRIDRPEHAPPPVSTTGPPTISIASPPLPPPSLRSPSTAPIAVESRIKRMVHLAIRSSQAVILVGPPGTGKTSLLKEVIAEIRADPVGHGFSEVKEPIIATPEESWATMDLLGGQTLTEDGELRFRPGRVLEAIVADQWLILDEANRADLDRIFGGLLTWLSVKDEVDLGPSSTHVSADHVMLGWADDENSSVENLEALEAIEPTDEPVRYLAGSQWRLLGTYNATDAQRVFRWGQALGRRFARVPVPAPSPEDFAEAIGELTQDLPDKVGELVASLYEAHHGLVAAQVGPAFFVHIPSYVENGLNGQEPTSDLIADLTAEAYLLMLGTNLSRLHPEDLDKLGDLIVNERNVFDEKQWDWLVDKVSMLG